MNQKNLPTANSTWEDESFIHMHPSIEDNACLKGRSMLSPKCWAHFPLLGGTLPPILQCITYYSCWIGSISLYCTLMSPIYRKDMFSRQSYLYIVLSYVLSTLCKEVPPSKMIYISSLLRCGLLSSSPFLLFLCYFQDLVA